jgi:hypothetical protein
LLALAGEITATPPRRELDMLLTAGERISMALLSMALNAAGCPAISFTGSQSGIITDSGHGGARIQEIRPIRIREELDRGRVVIVAGFQGVSREREVTTLGRGGSDTSAAPRWRSGVVPLNGRRRFSGDLACAAARHIGHVDFDTCSLRAAGGVITRAVEWHANRRRRHPECLRDPGTRVEGDLDVEKTGVA